MIVRSVHPLSSILESVPVNSWTVSIQPDSPTSCLAGPPVVRRRCKSTIDSELSDFPPVDFIKAAPLFPHLIYQICHRRRCSSRRSPTQSNPKTTSNCLGYELPRRVRPHHRALQRIAIDARPVDQPQRVGLEIPPRHRIVVAHPVLVQARLRLEPLPRKAQRDGRALSSPAPRRRDTKLRSTPSRRYRSWQGPAARHGAPPRRYRGSPHGPADRRPHPGDLSAPGPSRAGRPAQVPFPSARPPISKR